MNSRQVVTWVAVLVVAALAGCSDPTDATEANFARALEEHHSACPRIGLRMQFPHNRHDFEGPSAQLNALVEAGLLDVGESFRDSIVTWVHPYTLTETGLALAQPYTWSYGFSSGEGTSFCYASEYRVAEVTNFTAPAPLFGYMVSQVDYTTTIRDVADWARENETTLRAAFDGLDQDLSSLEEPRLWRAVLILTNEGWRHEHDVE